jgi:hypothetical protein
MGEGSAEPVLSEHGKHRGRRMCEGPELLPKQPEDEVLDRYEQAGNGVPRRVAEYNEAARMFRRCT